MPTMEDNLARLLRRNNVFTPERLEVPAMPENPMEEDILGNYDVTQRMSELFQPRSGAGNRFSDIISRMPERQKPGWHRRIVGGLIAANSPDRGRAYVERPYTNELEQWKASVENAYKDAQLEQDFNTQQRAIAQNVISNEMADRRLQRQLERDRVLRTQGDARIQQGNERLADADERLRQGNERIKLAEAVAKGGVLEVDDAGNAFIVGRDRTITPVDAEYLSAQARNQLMIARSRATGSRDRVRAEVIYNPDTGQLELGAFNLDTGVITPATVKPEAPEAPPRQPVTPGTRESSATRALGTQREVLNRARTAKNSNPKWSKWITIKGTEVTIKPPGFLGLTGPDLAEYRAMSQAIFGSNQPPAQYLEQSANAGRKAVIGPNGESGTVPAEVTSLPPGWRFK